MTAPPPLPYLPAAAHGGAFGKGLPTVVVIHCTESDNNTGTAESLAGPGWFGGPKAGTSAHRMFDRDSGVEMVRRSTVAYHAGAKGNTIGLSYEFCGRAFWSAAKWREPAQLDMLRRAAPYIADDLRAIGAPARWLSLTQLAAGGRGLCTHNDVRLALGGTTHSDPGPNFPYAELLGYVTDALTGPQEDDDMPTAREVALALLDEPIARAGTKPDGTPMSGTTTLRQTLAWADANNLRGVEDTITGLLRRPIPRRGTDALGKPAAGATTVEQTFAWLDSNLGGVLRTIGEATDRLLAALRPTT